MTYDTLDEIDARIRVLEVELACLRQRRNTLTPLGKVPTKLLLKILEMSQTPVTRHPNYTNALRNIFREPDTSFSKEVGFMSLDWLKFISSYKRLWDLALATPEIWQRAGIWVPGNVEWRQICLSRSGDLGPILYVNRRSDYDDSKDERGDELLEEMIEGATEAYLDLTEPEDDIIYNPDEYEYSLGGQLPFLRYLSVRRDSWELSNENLLDSSSTLTTLILLGVIQVTSWQPSFKNLRNFMISVTEQMPDDETDIHLFEWISSFTKLEVLSIEYIYGASLTVQLDRSTPLPLLTLPKLRILRLTSSICGIQRMLCTIQIHSMSGLDISIVEPMTLGPAINTNPLLSGRHQEIIRRTVDFWQRHASFAKTPYLLHAALVDPSKCEGGSQDQARLSLRSTPLWEVVDNTKPFCFFESPYCIYDPIPHPLITALHLRRDPNYGDAFNFAGQYDINALPLQTIFIEGIESRSTQEWSSISLLERWLVKRHEEGKPIRTLQIGKQATERAQHELQAMARGLKTLEIVHEVINNTC